MSSPPFPPPPPPYGNDSQPYSQQFTQSAAQPGAPPYQGFQPYAPPGAYAQAPAQQHPGTLPGAMVPLFTSGQVGWATFLGTSLGGAVLIAINERRIGRPQAATVAVLLGLLSAYGLTALLFAIPGNVPGLFGLLPIIVLRTIAQKRQGEIVAHHINAGGKAGSGWAAAGIGLACLAVVLIPAFVVLVIVEIIKNPS